MSIKNKIDSDFNEFIKNLEGKNFSEVGHIIDTEHFSAEITEKKGDIATVQIKYKQPIQQIYFNFKKQHEIQ